MHTLCLPVVLQAAQVYAGLNVQAVAGVLAKMGESAVLVGSTDTYILLPCLINLP